MALKTKNEYLESIKSLDLKANILGAETGNLPQHPLVEPSIQADLESKINLAKDLLDIH